MASSWEEDLESPPWHLSRSQLRIACSQCLRLALDSSQISAPAIHWLNSGTTSVSTSAWLVLALKDRTFTLLDWLITISLEKVWKQYLMNSRRPYVPLKNQNKLSLPFSPSTINHQGGQLLPMKSRSTKSLDWRILGRFIRGFQARLISSALTPLRL